MKVAKRLARSRWLATQMSIYCIVSLQRKHGYWFPRRATLCTQLLLQNFHYFHSIFCISVYIVKYAVSKVQFKKEECVPQIVRKGLTSGPFIALCFLHIHFWLTLISFPICLIPWSLGNTLNQLGLRKLLTNSTLWFSPRRTFAH